MTTFLAPWDRYQYVHLPQGRMAVGPDDCGIQENGRAGVLTSLGPRNARQEPLYLLDLKMQDRIHDIPWPL